MKSIPIYKLLDNYRNREESVQIDGWVRTNRDGKDVSFITLNDGTAFESIQIVYERSVLANYDEITSVLAGAALRIQGTVIETPQHKQPFEIHATGIDVLAQSEESYPIQPKRHTNEFLRSVAHMRPRTNTYNAVFRVRSVVAQLIHEYFADHRFVYVHSPILTGSDAEGAGEMFRVTTLDMDEIPKTDAGQVDYSDDFFGMEASLSVTGQLQAEAFALAFKNVYTFGPTFRAENSNTTRHASEFWMIEPEMAFADLKDNMALAEDVLKFVISELLKRCPSEMEFFNTFINKGIRNRLQKVLDTPFKVITYTEVIDILENSNKKFENPVSWGIDLATEHERYITDEVIKGPVFVTDYPKDIKAFYMRINDDNQTVAAMDLLVPGIGELIGGSQREERLDKLMERLEACGLDSEEYAWYLDLRRYGGVYHSGFGIGFERLLMYVTGMENIRDVSPIPRVPGYLKF